MAYGHDITYEDIDRVRGRAEQRWSPAPELGFAYRVSDCSYSISDEYGDHSHSTTKLELDVYPVLKRTGKGFRLNLGFGGSRWVAFAWTKQWASLTVEGALTSFIARKERQARIYEGRAKSARYIQDRARLKLAGAQYNPLTETVA